MRPAFCSLAFLVFSCIAAVAGEQAKWVSIGTLTCTTGTNLAVSCTYDGMGVDARRSYLGDITYKGRAEAIAAGDVLVWTVWAPEGIDPSVSLVGHYYGPRVEDSDPPGPAERTLTGGVDEGILLKPVINSEAGDATGALLGITELELRLPRA